MAILPEMWYLYVAILDTSTFLIQTNPIALSPVILTTEYIISSTSQIHNLIILDSALPFTYYDHVAFSFITLFTASQAFLSKTFITRTFVYVLISHQLLFIFNTYLVLETLTLIKRVFAHHSKRMSFLLMKTVLTAAYENCKRFDSISFIKMQNSGWGKTIL